MYNRLITKIYELINGLSLKILKRPFGLASFKQFIKHYFVGFVGSALNYSLFNVFKFANLGTGLANTLTNIIIIVTVFTLQKYFTYKVKEQSIRQPIFFLLNSLVYYILDTAILLLLVDYLKISPLISKIISMVLLSPLSFIFQKYIVFKKKSDKVIEK